MVEGLWKHLRFLQTWGPISLIVLAEPISSTLLLPFVYFMVRSFGYEEKDVGSRAGWISKAVRRTSLYLTNFISFRLFPSPAPSHSHVVPSLRPHRA